MLASVQSEKTVVARLRVRGAGLDPALAQLRLSSLFNTVTLRPAALPPSAILVIKHVRDPLPGHLGLRRSGLLRPPPRWEQAARELLAGLLRRALRPALGPVEDSAEAVIFLDRSELLACMASEWCQYGALRRWWWQSLFKTEESAEAIIREWLAASAYVPAALDYLAKRGEAAPFIRALKRADRQALLDAVVHTFALQNIERALGENVETGGLASRHEPEELRDRQAWAELGPMPARREAQHRPPWSQFVTATEARELAPDGQCLLGIGLMLQRAPAAVRSVEFARSLSSWRRATTSDRRTRDSDSVETHRARASSDADSSTPKSAIKFTESAQLQPSPRHGLIEQGVDADRTASSSTEKRAAKLKAAPSSRAKNRLPDVSPVAAEAEADRSGDRSDVADGLEDASPNALTVDAPEQALTTLASEILECETEFGGLFYLINLGIFLGLYGDFTAPAEASPPLSVWDFVALVGRQLLGEKIEDDAIWPLLSTLAGRSEQEPPGDDFRAPQSWRIPSDWLLSFAEKSVWHWQATGSRLRVTHARGFTLLDVPCESDEAAAQSLRRETENYPGAVEFELRAAGTVAQEDLTEQPPLVRWLGWLMPYVRARLEQALGLSAGSKDLSRVLCEHRARITCTATHLDIYLSLAQLPIGVRLSGLDRDPGWVPAAGRFIAFHFE